jgi:hypothetical protein
MSIFSFLLKNGKNNHDDFDEESNETIDQKLILSGTKRDYSGVKEQEVAMKVWLPEVAKLALGEMSSFANTTTSCLVRQTIFTYLYGRYDLMAGIERGERDFALNGPIMYSLSGTAKKRTAELGKNLYDVKVYISPKIKMDIKNLADKADITLSEFIREILISNLFGHTYLPERDDMLSLRIEFEEVT